MSPERKKLALALAIIVIALLVSAPLTMQQHLLEHSSLEISVSGGMANYTWSGNFIADLNSDYPSMGAVTSTVSIGQPGHNNSYLNTTVYGETTFSSLLNRTQFYIFITVEGTLVPNLPVKSITISEIGSVPLRYPHQIYAVMDPGGSAISNLSISSAKGNMSYYSGQYLSPPGVEPDRSNLTMSFKANITNLSPGMQGNFHFLLKDLPVYVTIAGIGPNSPFYMNFTVSLNGLPEHVGTVTDVVIDDTP